MIKVYYREWRSRCGNRERGAMVGHHLPSGTLQDSDSTAAEPQWQVLLMCSHWMFVCKASSWNTLPESEHFKWSAVLQKVDFCAQYIITLIFLFWINISALTCVRGESMQMKIYKTIIVKLRTPIIVSSKDFFFPLLRRLLKLFCIHGIHVKR